MNQKPRLSNKSALDSLFKQVSEIKVQLPAPKFSIGDYIINSKYKVISKIIDIRGIFENEDRTINYEMAEYIMKDIKNDARDTLMVQVDQANGSGTSAQQHCAERLYTRKKPVRAIDAYYHKINPEAAHALYGIRVTGETK